MAELGQGKYFGEIALISKNFKRTATVVAKTECEMATLSKTDYLKILEPLMVLFFLFFIKYLINIYSY